MRIKYLLFVVLLVLYGVSTSYSQETVIDLQAAMGGSSEDECKAQMEKRGFKQVQIKKFGKTTYTYWKNDTTGQCLSVRIEKKLCKTFAVADASECTK